MNTTAPPASQPIEVLSWNATVTREVVDPKNTALPGAQAEDIFANMWTTIEPQQLWKLVDVVELWRYRELLWLLAWPDIQVRYKQTVLGVVWAVLQPLAMMLVFSMIFGRIGQMRSGDLPYPLFVLAGLLPWLYFSNGISSASQSIVNNQNLITKVYFPRLLIPMGAIAAGFVDFAISMGLLALMGGIYGVLPGLGILMLGILLPVLVVVTLAVGTLLSALTVKYRDFKHIVPFMVQLWMFMTPAIYLHGTDSFGWPLRVLLPLNPAYGLIVNYRAAVLNGEFDFYALIISSFVSLCVLCLSSWYFCRIEREFADVI
ncbi:MAG: ABC transporter permease [Pirellulaceae bacterium]|nr:ABC transporter permease [Pirellulaceae bacterium]